MMQLVAWLAKPCACVHAFASQSAMQLRLKPEMPPVKQLNEHVRMAEQVVATGHVPQSAGHVLQVSPSLLSHLPSPHTAHEPQSAGHEMQVSSCEQWPSPHPAHFPQSAGQLVQSSVPVQ